MENLAWSLMIIILGVTYSSFKNQGVTSLSDKSHFQCVLPDCEEESNTVLIFTTQLDKFLSARRFDLDQSY